MSTCGSDPNYVPVVELHVVLPSLLRNQLRHNSACTYCTIASTKIPAMKKYIDLSILLACLLLNEASAGTALRRDGELYEGNRMLATDEPTGEATLAPEREDDNGGAPVAGREDICGEVRDRVIDCGATNPDRPQSCCDGESLNIISMFVHFCSSYKHAIFTSWTFLSIS